MIQRTVRKATSTRWWSYKEVENLIVLPKIMRNSCRETHALGVTREREMGNTSKTYAWQTHLSIPSFTILLASLTRQDNPHPENFDDSLRCITGRTARVRPGCDEWVWSASLTCMSPCR